MYVPSSDPITDVRSRLATALAGRYALEGESGWGGMALVFRARDLRHTRAVAIKVVRPELISTSAAQRFLDEIRMAARLQHPHIVPLYDSGEADGLLYFVMPYVEGETLRDRLDREDRLSLAAALAVTRDVADAIAFAHEAGIVHRDIKPENILLSGGHALVMDFGVAMALYQDERSGHTDPGLAVGTYCYMSPEQAANGKSVDGRADVYALGCVLYEMLTGHTPWADVQERLYGGAATRTMPPIDQPDVPERIEQALARALEFRPADRFATIGDFAEALALSGVPRGVLRGPRRRVSPLLVVAAGLAVVTAIVVGGFSPPRLDADAYVVAPCSGDTVGTGALYCQLLVVEALRQWDAVSVLEPADGVDMARQRGVDPSDPGAWYAVAEDAEARNVVRVDLTRSGDTLYMSGRVHHALNRQTAVPTQRVVLAVGNERRPSAPARLAASLIGLGAAARFPGTLGTRSTAAGQAYATGRTRLGEGRFREAQAAFADAAQADPRFGDALFWLAQVGAWLGDDEQSFRLTAERAGVLASTFDDPAARTLLPPLMALARGEYGEACARYRDLVAADSASYAAHLGLADCLARDPQVVPDSTTPSGFAFRASWEEAVEAFAHALYLEPGFIAPLWPRLSQLVIVNRNTLRSGRLVGTHGLLVAWPDMRADTAYFVPYPYPLPESDVETVPVPPSSGDLLTANRRFLVAMASEWTETYPHDGRGALARAEMRELEAIEARSPDELQAALDEVRRAAELGFDSVAVPILEGRLLYRLGRRADAADVAQGVRPDAPGDPEAIAGFLTLVGRADDAAAAYARAATPGVLAEVMRTRLRLDVYAGVGAPADSISRLWERLVSVITRSVPGDHRVEAQVSAEYLDALVRPVLGRVGGVLPGAPMTSAGRWAVRARAGAWADLRREILEEREQVEASGERDTPSPMYFALYQWALLQAGDTVSAVGGIDVFLGRQQYQPRVALRHPADAAGLVRLMVLRAETAHALGDGPTAARWARAVQEIWRHADPEVRASVSHLDAMIR